MANQSRRRRRRQSWGLFWFKENTIAVSIMVIAFFCSSSATSREVSGYPSNTYSIEIEIPPVLKDFDSANPPQQQYPTNRRTPLARRAEINPVWEKFRTVPDDDMPGYPEWSALAKDNLSSWDDETWTLRTTKLMPGIYPARLGLANGYVYFFFFFGCEVDYHCHLELHCQFWIYAGSSLQKA
jgi:hypothetical protein